MLIVLFAHICPNLPFLIRNWFLYFQSEVHIEFPFFFFFALSIESHSKVIPATLYLADKSNTRFVEKQSCNICIYAHTHTHAKKKRTVDLLHSCIIAHLVRIMLRIRSAFLRQKGRCVNVSDKITRPLVLFFWLLLSCQGIDHHRCAEQADHRDETLIRQFAINMSCAKLKRSTHCYYRHE